MKPQALNEEIACRLCNSPGCILLEKSSEAFGVYLCRVCDAAFVWPAPSEEVLRGAYSQSEYYEEWIGPQARRRVSMWKKRAKRVLGGLKPGKLLDVGCGEGSFLNEARIMGWNISGTEISEAGCRFAKERFGIAPCCSTLENAAFTSDSFDAITLWHVLEHVPDALLLMKEVFRVLKPGGIVVVACPNRRSWLYNAAYLIGRGRRPHLFHPSDRELHLWHFSSLSLRRVLGLASLTVERIEVDCGHVQFIHRCLDLTAAILHKVTGKIWSPAIEVWATKK